MNVSKNIVAEFIDQFILVMSMFNHVCNFFVNSRADRETHD